MKRVPEICIVASNVSPMVWWTGGVVRVVLPSSMMSLKPSVWHWVLVHELVHVRRGDHMVRWLEWAAGVLFWWNPVLWWARKQLRITEEVCCDAEVLANFRFGSRFYAESILEVVENFAVPAYRPLAMASEINSGGQLEYRIKMIMNQSKIRKASTLLQAGVLLGAITVLPLGIVYAENKDEHLAPKDEVPVPAAVPVGDAVIKAIQLDQVGLSLEDMKKRITAAVKAGKLTQKEGDRLFNQCALIEEHKKAVVADQKRDIPVAEPVPVGMVEKRSDHPSTEEYRKSLDVHVQQHRCITQKTADAFKRKYNLAYPDDVRVVITMIISSGPCKQPPVEVIQKNINAAVKAGEVTKKEADMLLNRYKKLKKIFEES